MSELCSLNLFWFKNRCMKQSTIKIVMFFPLCSHQQQVGYISDNFEVKNWSWLAGVLMFALVQPYDESKEVGNLCLIQFTSECRLFKEGYGVKGILPACKKIWHILCIMRHRIDIVLV